MYDFANLHAINKRLRQLILKSTTAAGSGHPSSSLSAVELMSTLMFGGFFRADLEQPELANNDRLIFSKGHASPLLYALYSVAGKVSEEELMKLRAFDSPLEGHPTMRFPYTEAATGSLGQGLSIGVGMALNAKYVDKLPYRTFVLLGDSEMAEGSNWEAIQLAEHYKLHNLIGILDVNRLGQRGETMYGHDIQAHEKRIQAFGWQTYLVQDGHNIVELAKAYEFAMKAEDHPVMIIARTMKGKGISLFENKEEWHGKALKKGQLEVALQELGEVQTDIKARIETPKDIHAVSSEIEIEKALSFTGVGDISTRQAYGLAIAQLAKQDRNILVLDAEVSNSTYAEGVKKETPEQFFEMYIAEQNMVGTALGLSRLGKIPFVSTFAAFFTRAYDQIRMSQYSGANIKFIGTHAGVSIGEDGSSQMGLEDIAMFHTIQNCLILYPSDAISAMKLVQISAQEKGNVYLRMTRQATPTIYSPEEKFFVGGSKILRMNARDEVTIIAAGVTLHEALKAYDLLQESGIYVRVIDLYSIVPLDVGTITDAVFETKHLVVVEDHYASGGIADIVRSAVPEYADRVETLAVTKMPRSGKPAELLAYEEIDANAIVKKVKDILHFL